MGTRSNAEQEPAESSKRQMVVFAQRKVEIREKPTKILTIFNEMLVESPAMEPGTVPSRDRSCLPADYENKVYAGVLGKLIGVYLGRPFEQWSHSRIVSRWGEIRRYVHQDLNLPLIVADDDITGTFTFIRALLDHGVRDDLSSREIGQTWLNYIAEQKHIIWWGGMGMSAEHTAYLRLAAGVPAPRSGSIELNGAAVAEEIGAQIFIDGWALVCPGDPDQAVRFAREAARVSHDGEAVHGAAIIAAMEALAFVENDIESLLERALTYVPSQCRVARSIADLRAWYREGLAWREALDNFVTLHGYSQFDTNCPLVSNHGLIILALLYGQGDFDTSMMIVNTAGYDTDCNSGNLGCLLGIRNGLETFDRKYDWRSPVNDRMFLPSADGHWGVRDAANIALEIANIGRARAGEEPRRPKNSAKFHFDLSGATHGFTPSELCPAESRIAAGESELLLRVAFPGERCDAQVLTFLPPGALKTSSYAAACTPMLYAGNQINAEILADGENTSSISARVFVRSYAGGSSTVLLEGPAVELSPGQAATLTWEAPNTQGWPIYATGIQLIGAKENILRVKWLTWSGTPTVTFQPPAKSEDRSSWERIFIRSVDHLGWSSTGAMNLIQNRGRGICHVGAREWANYRVTTVIEPFLAAEFGILCRVQGMTRYYALVFRDNRVQLLKMCHDEAVLAEETLRWESRRKYELALEIQGNALIGFVDGKEVLRANDPSGCLDGGGIGLLLTEGRIQAAPLRIEAAL